MTGVLTKRVEITDPIRLDDYSSAFGGVMGAHADQALHFNPTAGILRGAERSEGYASAYEQALRESPDYNPGPTLPGVQPFAPEKVLQPEEATKKYGIPGALTFDSNIPESSALQLRDLKRAELERQNVLRRAKGGFVEGAAGFGVEFLMSAVDPINVASAFIPVVGQARYAMWAERLGRPAARVVKGAMEGVVGAAAVEPIVLAAAMAEHADYTAADSMLNIAFGGLLGGGLHLTGGFIKDRLMGTATALEPHIKIVDEAPPQVREAALRGAIAAMAEDRPVRVGDIFKAGAEGPNDVLSRGNEDLRAIPEVERPAIAERDARLKERPVGEDMATTVEKDVQALTEEVAQMKCEVQEHVKAGRITKEQAAELEIRDEDAKRASARIKGFRNVAACLAGVL